MSVAALPIKAAPLALHRSVWKGFVSLQAVVLLLKA